MNWKTAKKIRSILLVVAIITLVVGLYKTNDYKKVAAHDPDDIKIEIVSCESKYDDRNYYVYMDFEIKNKTKETIDYIAVTTYFKDKNGKSIGTMSSEFGTPYGNGALNLEKGDKVIESTYLDEYKTSTHMDNMFVELYENGIEDMEITFEITSVRWADDYSYYR